MAANLNKNPETAKHFGTFFQKKFIFLFFPLFRYGILMNFLNDLYQICRIDDFVSVDISH